MNVCTVNFMRDGCDRILKVADGLIKSGYIGHRLCAVLKTTIPTKDYLNAKTTKHRYWMREKLNNLYVCREFNPKYYSQDIYDINMSMPVRSGGEMREAYKRSPEELKKSLGTVVGCGIHWARWFGAFDGNKLVAYILLRQIGNMGLYSMILGHGDHLKAGAMFTLHYFLYSKIQRDYPAIDFIMYGDWLSGTDGLKFWKKRCRFEPYVLMEVE